MYLIFDTETTGRPKNYKAPLTDSDNWPRLVQLAWQLHDVNGDLVEVQNFIVRPDGFEIPYNVVKIHGITTERALRQGLPLEEVLEKFNEAVRRARLVAGHNIEFDINIVGAEYYRLAMDDKPLLDIPSVDTMKTTIDFCALPGGRGGGFKYPQLTELHQKLFGEAFDAAHNAAADVEATARCFLEIVRRGIVGSKALHITPEEYQAFLKNNPGPVKAIGLNVQPYDPSETFDESAGTAGGEEDTEHKAAVAETRDFVHLHVHTQYSILDGLTPIAALAEKVKSDGQKAVAITDHGNMFGVKEFHKIMLKNGIKPILGMEAYMALRTIDKRQQMDRKNYHLVLLAKNKTGYHNLMKLASIANTEGFFFKARIDRDILQRHHEGLIALSACLGGEVPARIMEEGVDKGEEALLWYKEVFGDDFYIELQRHRATDPEMNREVFNDQQFVNAELIKLARKHNVKLVATNDVHFLNEEDYQAHDRLVCLNMGKDIDDPRRLRYTGQEWLKTKAEMAALFADLPEALDTTCLIADKIEEYTLDHDPIMPQFEIPEGFEDEDDYLRHITYEGAKKRWETLTPEIKERIDFELETIKKMGFPGYFLIVWDFLKAAREMGVIVGPGRGSAAGSAVAYCLKITDIDPIKYNLLFERFLNPDRISMPDIDIDFDDEGREKVLAWVKNKYGARRVAHIITFGSMAAKSSIRDVARVQKMDLGTADYLAKMVPDKPGTTLAKAFKEVKELDHERKNGKAEIRSVLEYATKMEGAIRNTGTHACGIIIGRDDLDRHIPLNSVSNSTLDYATQYDGSHVENIGLLKMDFLGLKTLSIIKDAIENIRISKGETIDIDSISLEDKKTFELYARGETLGLFQFESEGMRNHLKALKPTKFDDLIAMNALYRPGPMDYIEDFIKRKHGLQEIKYDLPEMEEYLAETYGITVYQEQVMLLSRKLAGFTRGQSDSLRKAMGKKIKYMMDELKEKFLEGGQKNGHDKAILEKIWKDWEAFAKYAFNKSHATCYTYVSFQTAWLKAHYPSEFMASVLSHNLSDIKKLNFYLSECKRMGIKVLGPHINESYSGFMVNSKGEIRYGLSGIKGVGDAAVQEIITERKKNGPYASAFDLVKRVNLRTVNKKTMESLAMVGAFDELGNAHRSQFFYQEEGDDTIFLEKILKFGAKYQEQKNSNQISLFGEMEEQTIVDPSMPVCEPWSQFKRLKIEKELMGFYLSGHPLDSYRDTLKTFGKPISLINKVLATAEPQKMKKINGTYSFGGIVTGVQERTTKKGDAKYGIVSIEDEDDSIDLFLFSETWLKYRHLFSNETFVFLDTVISPRYKRHPKDSRKKGYSDEIERLEIRVVNAMLLKEVMNQRAKEIKVKVDIHQLDNDKLSQLVNAVKKHDGNTRLKLYFYDKGDQLPMKYPHGIDANAFVQDLREMEFFEFKIN